MIVCVCQSGLPKLYYTVSSVECLYLFSPDLAGVQVQALSTRRQGHGATRHAV